MEPARSKSGAAEPVGSLAPQGKAAPIRVALFTGAYNHIADGVSLTLNRLVGHLSAQEDFEVLVFAPSIDDPPISHQGTLHVVPSVSVPGRSDYRLSLGLGRAGRRRLAAFRPDLVHIATPDILGRAALGWARKRDVPVVASYHTHFSSYLKYYRLSALEPAMWAFLRRFYRSCREVYVPSESMLDVLQQHGIGARLRIWPRGVDTDLFQPDRRSEGWRAGYGIGPEEPTVGFVSRLVWEKGLDVFVEAVRMLKARGLAFRTAVIGDGPARPDLENRLPTAVFTGHLNGESLATAYASLDVFLFPSDTETFGNVTLEAMASGLPTVCADATGSRSLVSHGETGFLAPPADVEAFAGAAGRLIEEPALRRRLSQAARRHATRYAWDTVLQSMAEHYRRVLGRPAPAGAPATPTPNASPTRPEHQPA